MATTTFALGGSFNDSGKIEDLNFGSFVFEDSWDGGEGCECVGGDFGAGFGDFGKQGGFSLEKRVSPEAEIGWGRCRDVRRRGSRRAILGHLLSQFINGCFLPYV